MNDNEEPKILNLEEARNKKNGGGPPNQPKKMEPHMFHFTLTDGEELRAGGHLSVGPVFVAVVDDNDYVELVLSVPVIKYIKKGKPYKKGEVVSEDEIPF